jgi:BlaI family penicillinase repressor
MAAPIHVTEAESAILEALWRHGPLPPARLIAEVKAQRAWGEATIKTLLGRLMQKKAVRSVRENGLVRYHPLIEREAYLDAEITALANRLFGGDALALAAFLARPRAQ